MGWHILHTEASTGFGGQERRILQESHSLREGGARITIAAPENAVILERARQEGFETLSISFRRRDAASNLWKLLRYLRNERVDLIHTHSSWDSWLAGVAGRIGSYPVLRTRHTSTTVRGGLNARLLYHAIPQYVITTAESTRQALIAATGAPSQRFMNIPTGIDFAKIPQLPFKEELRMMHGIDCDRFVVGTLCILRSWKGVDSFIRSLRYCPEMVGLVIGDGPQRASLEELAIREGIHNVRFVGLQNEPYTWLQMLDGFALLSRHSEGVSQAVLQAASLKIPLVTTSTGGLQEVVQEGFSGWVVPVDDPKAVATAWREIQHNRLEAKTRAANAYKKVRSSYEWQEQFRQLWNLYATVLS